MSYSLWTLIVSGALLFVFFILFSLERSMGRRVLLSRTRSYIDLKLISLQSNTNERFDHWKSFNMRGLLHYLFHQLLGALLFINRLVERYISRLRQHNRQVAHRTKQASNGNNGHLAAIAKHKEDTALTDEEKNVRKEQSMHN